MLKLKKKIKVIYFKKLIKYNLFKPTFILLLYNNNNNAKIKKLLIY